MEIKLSITIDEEEVPVEVSYHIANDGIGHYEFWGAKCNDRGEDYPDIDDIIPVTPNPAHLKYITENFENLATKLADEIAIED